MPDHCFSKEIFPTIQSKPLLKKKWLCPAVRGSAGEKIREKNRYKVAEGPHTSSRVVSIFKWFFKCDVNESCPDSMQYAQSWGQLWI